MASSGQVTSPVSFPILESWLRLVRGWLGRQRDEEPSYHSTSRECLNIRGVMNSTLQRFPILFPLSLLTLWQPRLWHPQEISLSEAASPWQRAKPAFAGGQDGRYRTWTTAVTLKKSHPWVPSQELDPKKANYLGLKVALDVISATHTHTGLTTVFPTHQQTFSLSLFQQSAFSNKIFFQPENLFDSYCLVWVC